MTDIVKRKSIADMYQLKLSILGKYKILNSIDEEINKSYEEINGYRPYDIRYHGLPHGKNAYEKHVDRACWQYLIRLFELEKYMLCSDFEKMRYQIDNYDFPVFTIENAEGYIASLKDIIYDNVRTMMKSVYQRITEQTYYTGGTSFNSSVKKKRNNNGIDKHFIITTHDYTRVYGYYTVKPTITDDLEKLCYILNGKSLPEETLIRSISRNDENPEAENEYFKIRLCKNGNTHYWIEDNTRNKLNIYGADPSKIGENIKIKVFDKAS